MTDDRGISGLSCFHPCTRDWFLQSFAGATRVQAEAWPEIAAGRSALLLAPTGSGKTLAAFLAAIDRLFFQQLDAAPTAGVRVLYISPLKALGVDVDRNLRAPIAGLRAFAERRGQRHQVPRVAVRSGDTSAQDRAALLKTPPEILITTPESLFLMLTSRAAQILASVETVIVDEIHALAATKRGAHLVCSLERLERLRRRTVDGCEERVSEGGSTEFRSLQRIGLSATQRPLEEIARLLGGGEAPLDGTLPVCARPVRIVDASERRRIQVTIETPAEELTSARNPSQLPPDIPIGSAASAPSLPSVWPAIQPRLLELIRQNRSTMIFVNSRRLAERLASAINELADEELVLAHHGSVAKDTRAMIEDRLKRGDLRAIVATSSMELGIDMGHVDLVIQIEAPPSIASGTQRIGRAGHQVGAVSTGIIFPKYRGDLLACSAATGAMTDGWVEETRYPRNPLDILAQQMVAVVSQEDLLVDELFAVMRGAAPFFELPRASFDAVLDLLTGRYPSDDFSELKPRLNWDRLTGIVSARKGAQRLAILNGGTIPDRGLYGVFLVGSDGESGSRCGELDEEMVFECRPGDVFLLGASSWRVMDITRDRVLVVPAPGEAGRMPFWRGDGPGRPLEFGRAIGRLARQLTTQSQDLSLQQLQQQHGLNAAASEALLDYLQQQLAATSEVPSDTTIVIESFQDEVGDRRIVILSPFGSRVHAPWAMLLAARLQRDNESDVDLMWTDDGIVFRMAEAADIPPDEFFFPHADEVEDELVRELAGTAMFAARFRENAARSLLLPRRSPQRRTPLWLQRRRAADLLKVAARFHSFPILMETYRECLRDVFDMPGLTNLLKDVKARKIRVRSVRSEQPSPFASAVLFNFVGNFIYNSDAPLAERRAQALSLDYAQLKELLGSADLRDLFDPAIVAGLQNELQRLSGYNLRDADDLHALLLWLGPLSADEITNRAGNADVDAVKQWRNELVHSRRIFSYTINHPGVADLQGSSADSGGQTVVEAPAKSLEMFAATEDAGRLRDAIGIVPPPGLALAFLEPVQDAITDLVSRFARTHVPFSVHDAAEALQLSTSAVQMALTALQERGRVVDGEFLPGKTGREWCDVQVLRLLKSRSLAALRREVEPVDQQTLAEFLPVWHGINRPRNGLDGLLDAIEQLQGAPLPATSLETEILPARVTGFRPADLDELCVQGEVVWRGYDSTGSGDGRIGLFLTDSYRLLAPSPEPMDNSVANQVRELLNARGALFFEQIAAELHLFPNDLLTDLWQMVWNGEVTNDTLTPLRSLRPARKKKESRQHRGFRSRRQSRLPGSEGRWSLLPTIEFHSGREPAGASLTGSVPTVTERQMAIAAQLVERHGVLTREMLSREEVDGGFAGLYPVLKAMEEAGRIRRGYFVEGLGAAQFAAPGAEDLLRSCRQLDDGVPRSGDDRDRVLLLAATDPANPWGNALSWPTCPDGQRPQRTAGARVFVHRGILIGYLSRTKHQLTTFLPPDDPPRRHIADRLAKAVAGLARPGSSVLLKKVDAVAPEASVLSETLLAAGFQHTSQGFLHQGRFAHA
ncbi:MAG: DEAD/DEAH box helicase [Planctomycetaceae bacterium]